MSDSTNLFTSDAGGVTRPATADEILDAARTILARRVRKGASLSNPHATRDFLRLQLASRDHEVFAILFLENRRRFIEFVPLFGGTIDGASVHPREVVMEALARNAAADALAAASPPSLRRRVRPACLAARPRHRPRWTARGRDRAGDSVGSRSRTSCTHPTPRLDPLGPPARTDLRDPSAHLHAPPRRDAPDRLLTEPASIRALLAHLGEPTTPPSAPPCCGDASAPSCATLPAAATCVPRDALRRRRQPQPAPCRLHKRPSPSPGSPLTAHARFPRATEAPALVPAPCQK